ncbi:hypothetical protein HDC94_002853 [Leifsonia sp. AK011]|uniref:hypothetical protein n=1 Tax=Leifsonia sp. AK011 TaxID=2723075 RepID=UPI0015CA7590|nr:hypothetical protein [Leifsonia sp. AK011]NYF11697.1 hypothetical protein [Leifsonia sp. AK011]
MPSTGRHRGGHPHFVGLKRRHHQATEFVGTEDLQKRGVTGDLSAILAPEILSFRERVPYLGDVNPAFILTRNI